VVIGVEDDLLVVRKAAHVARRFRGYLRETEAGRDLVGELIADRRAEAESETGANRRPAPPGE
jgi:hypothetical protein